MNNPTKHLRDYLGIQGVDLPEDIFHFDESSEGDTQNSAMETL